MRHLDDEDLDLLGVLLDQRILSRLSEMETRIMATLTEAGAVDADIQTQLDQVVILLNADTALIQDLKGQIGSGNLPPDQQAAVDGLFAQLTAQREQLKSVILADTPAPEPTPEPAPEPTPAPVEAPTAEPTPDVPPAE